MKSTLKVCILFTLLPILSFGQTKMWEAKIMMEDNLQILFDKGYEGVNIDEISGYCDKDDDRVVMFTQIYRPGENIPCGTYIYYHRDNSKYVYEYCIPAPNSSPEVLSYVYNDWWNSTSGEDESEMAHVLLYSLAKYNSYLLGKICE